jgi:hypothetical protein
MLPWMLLAAWLAPAAPSAAAQQVITMPAPVASADSPPGPAASAGGISDAVARCEAETSALERRTCRRQLAQQAPTAR